APLDPVAEDDDEDEDEPTLENEPSQDEDELAHRGDRAALCEGSAVLDDAKAELRKGTFGQAYPPKPIGQSAITTVPKRRLECKLTCGCQHPKLCRGHRCVEMNRSLKNTDARPGR